MNSNEILENINKCSRCGLCQQVCPIYDIKKSENACTRGKLMQILGLEKNILKPSKNSKNTIDMCLNCEKCLNNCPSSVNSQRVFHLHKKNSLLSSFLNSRFLFKLKLSMLSLFSLFKRKKRITNNSKIFYFKGCVNKKYKKSVLLPDIMLFEAPFKCCGLPYLVKSKFKTYEKYSSFNEELIEKADFVVFDCATCLSAVQKYNFKNPKNKEKLIFYTEIYEKIKLKMKLDSKYIDKTVTFHHPCHLFNSGTTHKEIKKVFENIDGLKYVQLEQGYTCCGFGGDFFLRHPIIAFKIALKKARQIKSTGAQIIFTACPTCTWSLKFSLFVLFLTGGFKSAPKVLDLPVFLQNNTDVV